MADARRVKYSSVWYESSSSDVAVYHLNPGTDSRGSKTHASVCFKDEGREDLLHGCLSLKLPFCSLFLVVSVYALIFLHFMFLQWRQMEHSGTTG